MWRLGDTRSDRICVLYVILNTTALLGLMIIYCIGRAEGSTQLITISRHGFAVIILTMSVVIFIMFIVEIIKHELYLKKKRKNGK